MDKKKRKEWIKNAIIIFLVVMLILTFCSDTIMNMYLPEVSTEAASAGKIREVVRGSGSVEVNQACQVKLETSRTIRSVNVKVGQEVKEGDVLFTLETGDSTDLDTAKNTYLELQAEYQKKLLGNDYNYSKDKQAIENARKEYEKALDDYNAIDTKNKKLERMNKRLAAYDKKIATLESSVTAYDARIAELGAKPDVDTCQSDLTAKKRALVTLQNEKQDLESDLAALKSAGAPAGDITAKDREVRNKGVEVTNAEADVNTAQAALNTAKANSSEIEKSKAEKDKASASITDYKNKQQVLTTNIETFKAEIGTKEQAKAAVDEKENAWNTLVAEFETKKSEDDHTIETDKIELNSIKQKLIVQKKLVENLMETASQTEVKAIVAGKISNISCAAGDITQPDTPLAVISSEDKGYMVKVSVTKDQAAKVKVGQNATVDNYWYGDITAVLSSVAGDTENPGNVVLTFVVNGENINEGDNLSISIGGEEKSYDVIVPKSSIYEDNNGKFVLTLDSKNTPLGERYIATRHDVTVLAEDDVHAAISSDLYGYEYVIMTASEALTPGEQVKLKE